MLLKKARFISFTFNSPYENMAIDESLITIAAEAAEPVLRVYGWRPRGISIGKNQEAGSINLKACVRDNVPVVRRITGGGAIFHADELTYCLAWP